MSALNARADTPADWRFADQMISVAESRSIDDLGNACSSALGQFTGSSTMGLYRVDGTAPSLIYSADANQGFLDDYEAGIWKADPVLDRILSDGRITDGASLFGADRWRGSSYFELLRQWGLNYNMGGPIRSDGRIVGVLFTATADSRAPYSSDAREGMGMLCRAASVAMSGLMHEGRLASASGQPCTVSVMPAAPALPRRAAQVAEQLCRGRTNKEIARELGISDETVKEYVSNLCKRFGAANRTDLVARLLSDGVLATSRT